MNQEPKTHIVNTEDELHEAIKNANDGDIIKICSLIELTKHISHGDNPITKSLKFTAELNENQKPVCGVDGRDEWHTFYFKDVDVTMENIRVERARYIGIFIYYNDDSAATVNVNLKNIICYKNKGDGIYIGRYANVDIEHVVCYKNKGNGFCIIDCSNVNFNNVKCNKNKYAGIYVADCSNVNLNDIRCDENRINGINIIKCENINIDGVKCNRNKIGIEVSEIHYEINVNNAICNYNKLAGILIGNADKVNVSQSKFHGNDWAGLSVHGGGESINLFAHIT